MDRIFEAIEEWMRNLLTGMVSSNLTTMYTDVNEKTGQIAAQVGQTPQGWNGNIFSMIQNLSDSVIVPIAGMIITFVLCYELISMLTEKNNMHDIDTWMFFKYFFKMWVAVWIVSHTFTITMAVFDVGQSVVSRAAGVQTRQYQKGQRRVCSSFDRSCFGHNMKMKVFHNGQKAVDAYHAPYLRPSYGLGS